MLHRWHGFAYHLEDQFYSLKNAIMKKIILGLLLLAGVGTKLVAQTPAVYTNSSTPVYTTPDNKAYATPTTTVVVPVYTERAFLSNYPNVSRTNWYRVNDDWYRVTYVDNGPWYTMGYYAWRGESYPISLPVLENKVPDDVVNAVMNRFSNVYDITETVGTDMQTQYIVRTIDANGTVVSNRVNASASDVPQ
jgi:hypothetical protein